MTRADLVIETPGTSFVTDLGRPAAVELGQLTGGALDQYSASVANTLVGRPAGDPLIEMTAFDFAARTSVDLLVAVTGAAADLSVDGVAMPQWEPFVWPAGTTLAVRGIRGGMRCYLALGGLIAAPALLGSVAPDTVLGFGPPLRRGDRLPVTVDPLAARAVRFGLPLFRFGALPLPLTEPWVIDVCEGPDIDEFAGTAGRLFDTEFLVGQRSNHVGIRLEAESRDELPRRTSTTEVLSRGVPIGAVEVPSGRELLVLHRGRGVTAGYPVLAVATTASLSLLGQVRPGQRVRFRLVDVDTALAATRARAEQVDELRARVHRALTARGIGPRPTSPTTACLPHKEVS
ncbi:allophanate hydrolase [Enemella evansiae]|uniref:5-oxoprolinase subunit C family protein n=1 Tax=Enemella evansiae TaxID=2016499 RepID=UPI000B968CC8|nr:biotin-dependent carboxyltransferase family protein [Enemella evansiae]OYN98021.1 allophanate hydrolase [Enemella evansiae]